MVITLNRSLARFEDNKTSTDVGGCSVGFSGGSGAEMLSPEEEPLLLEDVPETRPNAVAVYGTRWW